MPRPKNLLIAKFYSTNEKNEMTCNNDQCEKKVLNSHSGNLERHLKLLHPRSYEKYICEKKSHNKTVPVQKPNNTTNSINKKHIELAILELFTKNGHPLHMANDRAFKILVKPVFDAVGIAPNAHNIYERIFLFGRQIKLDIVKTIRGKLISLKIDAATRRDVSLLGINIHYIENGQIEIKTLAVKELKSHHTEDYIKSIIFEVLEEYSIDTSHILTITTDNGGNMVKAFKDLNPEEDDIEDINEENNAESNMEEIMTSIRSNFALNSVTGVRCGPHILQLCVNEVIKIPEVKETLEKIRSVVKKLRTQNYINILKYGQFKKPVLDCVTSWSSTFIMIERLVEMRNIIQLLSSEIPCLHLSSGDWKFAEQFLETFKAVYDASLKLQNEQLCFSELYIIVMDTIFKLDALPLNAMCIALKNSLNRRKEKLFDIDLFIASVFLDPRVKICLNAEQKDRAKKYITKLYERINTLEANTTSPHSSLNFPGKSIKDESLQYPSESNNNSAPSFCAFLENLDPLDPLSLPSSSDLETDLTIYDRQPRLPQQTDVLKFWSSQNNALSCVADVILAIPCTKVSVERLFSAMKYVLSDQRNRLTGFDIEHILLVKLNGVFDYDK